MKPDQLHLRYFFCLVFLWCSTQSYAQSARFKQLTVDDGLLQNSVGSINQDKAGYIWIATGAGINMYDGYDFKSFRHKPNDPGSLSANEITFVFPDSKNNLWIGTRYNGVNRMDLKTHKITRLKSDEKGNGNYNAAGAFCILEDKNGFIYIGGNNGLNIYNPSTKKFTYILHDPKDPNSLPGQFVRNLSFDTKGKLWIATGRNGLCVHDPVTKKITCFNEQATDPQFHINNNAVQSVFCDSHDRVWISCWSGGINVYDQREKKMYTNSVHVVDFYFKQFVQDKTRNDSVYGGKSASQKYMCLKDLRMVFDMTEDKQGNIWFVTAESGLVCFNPETFKVRNFKNNPDDPSTVADNNLLSIYVDRSGLIWAGCLTAGISIFNPYSDKFGFHKAESNKPMAMASSEAWSTHLGKHTRHVYIGTKGYVYLFDGKNDSFKNYVVDKKGNSLLNSQAIVQSLFEDDRGRLWVGVNGSGILLYDTTSKTLKNYNTGPDPGNLIWNAVMWMVQDRNKTIWLGMGDGGLERFLPETETFEHNYYQPGQKGFLSSYTVKHIAEDKKGNLWVATDSGINVVDIMSRKLSYLRHDKKNAGSLPHDNVNSLFLDNMNRMWVGTQIGLGFYDFKTKKFIDVTKQCKVGENGVLGITSDLNNNLWLITAKGITRFNTVTNKWKTYDVTDGLQSNEFSANSILHTDDGYILCAGAKGINYFLPEHLRENLTVPGVVITNFLLRNQPLRSNKVISEITEVKLDYNHYFFTIEFAALDFTNVGKNKYRYRLEGFNNEWVDLGHKRQVTFVNLDPGEYLFRVAGSNNDGTWNEEGAILKITITPPFWQTTWFYILCGIAIIAGIYAFIKFRERKLNREKAVLEEKVNVRTVELREEKEKVEGANKEIRDSINYAQKIQNAIMPTEEDFKKTLPNSFILFKPKDIVSGDFYWISHLPEGTVLYATADCTGHGVPGGFMSMLGTSFLNEIVNEKNITDPAKVLGILREKVIAALKQTGSAGENKDGMDITLVKLDLKNKKLVYAGANNPIWIQRKGETGMVELKPDKQPIGYYVNQTEFTNQTVPLQKGDCVFSFTDGFADQFGGPRGKKFKYSSLEKTLLELDKNNFSRASEKMNAILEEWKTWAQNGESKGYEQTDDVCVIGVMI